MYSYRYPEQIRLSFNKGDKFRSLTSGREWDVIICDDNTFKIKYTMSKDEFPNKWEKKFTIGNIIIMEIGWSEFWNNYEKGMV